MCKSGMLLNFFSQLGNNINLNSYRNKTYLGWLEIENVPVHFFMYNSMVYIVYAK